MNIPKLEKPYYRDGGSYYTPKDKEIIKEIQKKTDDLLRNERRLCI